MLVLRWLVTLCCVLAVTGCVSVETGGYAAADGRAFPLAPKYLGQLPGNAVSLVAEPQIALTSKNEKHAVTLRPFYRLDPVDSERSHADLRRADYRLSLEHFQLGAGIGSVTWGVLESAKPTDVLNQIDFVDAIDGSAKLGQPYVEAAWVGETAALRFYYLPYFRERTFPGLRGRLRLPVVVDTNNPIYEPPLGQFQPSGAVRFNKTLGDLDVSVGALSGLTREPRFVAELSTGLVAPRYDQMQQIFGDLQWVLGPVSLKAEGFVRAWGDDFRVFGGGGAGADYTFFKLIGQADVSLAGEFLFDTRPVDAAPIFFDHDAFGGLRLALNDSASTELLGGAITDLLDGSTFVRAQASRRFGEHFRLSLGAMIFAVQPGKLESAFRRDSHGMVRVAYYF